LQVSYVRILGQCKHFKYFDCRKARLVFPHYIFSFGPRGIQQHFFYPLGVEAKLVFGLIQEVFFHFVEQ